MTSSSRKVLLVGNYIRDIGTLIRHPSYSCHPLLLMPLLALTFCMIFLKMLFSFLMLFLLPVRIISLCSKRMAMITSVSFMG